MSTSNNVRGIAAKEPAKKVREADGFCFIEAPGGATAVKRPPAGG